MKDSLIDHLRTLAPLDDQDVEIIKRLYTKIEFAKGQYLLHVGDYCQDVFFIEKGIVRIGVYNHDEQEITINFRKDNESVSDYKSFTKRVPASFFIQAIEDTVCYKTDRYGLKQMYEETKHGNLIGRMISESVFFDVYELLVSFHIDSAETRYTKLLKEKGELVNRIPQNYLASYIGVQPQSLSRIKRRYIESQKAGE